MYPNCMHTKLLCYSKLLINKVLGRTQCGDEEDRCIFGESLFVPDQVAVSHLLPLSSLCPDNWSKGGRRRRRRRRRLADGLCILPLKPFLRLASLGCQAHMLNCKINSTNRGTFSNFAGKILVSFFFASQGHNYVQIRLPIQKNSKKVLAGLFLGHLPKMHYSAL